MSVASRTDDILKNVLAIYQRHIVRLTSIFKIVSSLYCRYNSSNFNYVRFCSILPGCTGVLRPHPDFLAQCTCK